MAEASRAGGVRDLAHNQDFCGEVFCVDSAARPEVVGNLTEIVRKSAHAFEYLVLGVLMAGVVLMGVKGEAKLRTEDVAGLHMDGRNRWWQIWRGRNRWWLAVAPCLVFAISDEVHQVFVAGRACEVRDVVNDMMAAMIGVGVVMAVRWVRARRGKGHSLGAE